jgi:hypothetical protein
VGLALTTERLLRLYTSAPKAFWRHDVDVSLDAAVQMARFAELAGVKTTFAIMARGEFYNPFSYPGREAIFKIRECGHRLIPHVHYRIDGSESIYEAVEEDRGLWDQDYPGVFDLSLVCFHMPPKEVLWNRYEGLGEAHGFNHCHEPQWNGRYVSDSRREWTEEKEARVTNHMQVALHPEHWFGPDAVRLAHLPNPTKG